jgi:hypothetical protein
VRSTVAWADRPTSSNTAPLKDVAVKPTRKQLAYLKSLAEKTGTTFAYPQTSDQASAEIKRLQGQPRSGAGDVQRERPAPAAPDEVHRALLSGLLSHASQRAPAARASSCRRARPGAQPPVWVMVAELVETRGGGPAAEGDELVDSVTTSRRRGLALAT